MKIKLEIEQEFEVKYLRASCGVRYWEDATVDGVDDENGDLIPCREGDYWKPLIDLQSGQIVNWKKGVSAQIHYKVCDDGTYALLDENYKEIVSITDYVPSIMSPKESGYGDYVIMDVNEDGFIQNWTADLSKFENVEK